MEWLRHPWGWYLYIGIIIFPHIGITQSTRHKITQRKRSIRKETQKVRAPIKLTCHWIRQLYIRLQFIWHLTLSLDSNIAIKSNQKKVRKPDRDNKWIQGKNMEKQNFEDKFKDRNSILWWYFCLSKEKWWLNDVGKKSWSYVKCAQHAAYKP